jgi:hypothetical protein
MQREEPPAMGTALERIAAKARCEPNLRFTSLAHHLTRERVWENLGQIPTDSAPGVDGQTVTEAKESFGDWIEPMLQSVHREGYHAPDIRRVYIPKPGKHEKRPLACLVSRTGPSSEAPLKYSPPSTSKTFCRARLGDDLGGVPITRWQPSMR